MEYLELGRPFLASHLSSLSSQNLGAMNLVFLERKISLTRLEKSTHRAERREATCRALWVCLCLSVVSVCLSCFGRCLSPRAFSQGSLTLQSSSRESRRRYFTSESELEGLSCRSRCMYTTPHLWSERDPGGEEIVAAAGPRGWTLVSFAAGYHLLFKLSLFIIVLLFKSPTTDCAPVSTGSQIVEINTQTERAWHTKHLLRRKNEIWTESCCPPSWEFWRDREGWEQLWKTMEEIESPRIECRIPEAEG